MTGPRYPSLIQALPATVPFVGPEVQERRQGHNFLARLGANENVFGPSPKAIAAMQEAAKDVWKYPDPSNFDLISALAAHHKRPFDTIMVGEGIDGLLGYLVRLLVAPGDAVVTSAGAYPTFNYHVAASGGRVHAVPYKDDTEDLGALVEKASETDAKLVYFANPDNPMGTWHSADAITQGLRALPDGTLLLLDEAYIEFAPKGTAPDLEVADPRVVRLRTFSKAYGMAGARVGYAMGAPGLITSFNKLRNHFGMCRISQAGALAALQDTDWLVPVIREVSNARARLAQIAADNDLRAVPSATNFVAIDCGKDGDFARAVLGELLTLGIFVRMPFVAPQDRCIRVSAGTPQDLDLFAEALPKALARARAA